MERESSHATDTALKTPTSTHELEAPPSPLARSHPPCLLMSARNGRSMVVRRTDMKGALVFAFITLLLSFSEAQSDQQAALLAIKDAVKGSSTNLTSWITTSRGPCLDKWIGVKCDDSSRITALNLSSFSLSGTVPMDAFTNLTSLVSLDFSNNQLERPFPTLDGLTSINDVNFSKNRFNEPFPTTLFSLKTLVELRMDNNKFTGTIPENISNLELLEQLWLGNNSLLSGPLPKGLAFLHHLQILSAWGTSLEMHLPDEWGVWVNITYMNLHNAFLSGPLPEAWGENFTKIERLHLYDNELTGSIPESWKSMKRLREFRFENNQLSGRVSAWLNEIRNDSNTYVNLACNYLTGSLPTLFNADTWKGNCFDTNKQEHEQKCPSGSSCSEFLSGASNRNGSASRKKSFPEGAIAGIITGVIVLLLVTILFLIFWIKPASSNKRRRKRADQGVDDWTVPEGVRRFSYREVARATKTFDKSCEIGEGGFGKVYLAQLEDGKRMAIKRASDLSFQGTKEFQNEITLLSRLHHRHLVRLEGFCDDQDEQILVYEFLSNGNLHRHLLDKHASTLNWYRRLEIALAVAQGLDYLHTFADPPVIHRDVKPSNILLDDNMVAKVSDFGISKANPEMDTHVSTSPAGTAGYLDPEYFLRRQLTTASDVYGYGVVLLELITGQLAIDHKRLENYNLVSWVKPKLVRKGIHAVIDTRLGPNFPAEQYEEIAHLAMGCTAYERRDRPTMQTVASTLERILSGLIPPPQHLMPTMSPSLSPLIQENNSNSQISGDRTENTIGVALELGFRDTVVEPR